MGVLLSAGVLSSAAAADSKTHSAKLTKQDQTGQQVTSYWGKKL